MIRIVQIPWGSTWARGAAAVRMTVFVEEQGVPAALEMDDLDTGAIHLVAVQTSDEMSEEGAEGRAETGEVVGTLRILDRGEDAKISRVAVRAELRRMGIGQAMMLEAIRLIREDGFDQIVLSAQLTAAPFYERLGFMREGPEYEEAGMRHVRMVLPLRGEDV